MLFIEWLLCDKHYVGTRNAMLEWKSLWSLHSWSLLPSGRDRRALNKYWCSYKVTTKIRLLKERSVLPWSPIRRTWSCQGDWQNLSCESENWAEVWRMKSGNNPGPREKTRGSRVNRTFQGHIAERIRRYYPIWLERRGKEYDAKWSWRAGESKEANSYWNLLSFWFLFYK